MKQSTYFYLKYREGKEMNTRYIPQKDVGAVREQAETRRNREKKVKQSTYFDLKCREGKKVISRYIPQKDVDAVREQVEKRRHIETMIRSLQEERAIAEKALEGQL